MQNLEKLKFISSSDSACKAWEALRLSFTVGPVRGAFCYPLASASGDEQLGWIGHCYAAMYGKLAISQLNCMLTCLSQTKMLC